MMRKGWGGRDKEETENKRRWKLACVMSAVAERNQFFTQGLVRREDFCIEEYRVGNRGDGFYANYPYQRYDWNEAIAKLKGLIEDRKKAIVDAEAWLKISGNDI
jgi:hypothetical protein